MGEIKPQKPRKIQFSITHPNNKITISDTQLVQRHYNRLISDFANTTFITPLSVIILFPTLDPFLSSMVRTECQT